MLILLEFLIYILYTYVCVCHRLVCSLGDNDKDTDEEINQWSRRCRPETTSEKMQSDSVRMKEHLSILHRVRLSLQLYYSIIYGII